MSEDEKVEAIMRKFPAKPAREAHANMLQKVVGRIVACGDQSQVMYAPASGKPCVYYHIEVEEQFKVREYDDESGNWHTSYQWETIIEEDSSRDFYLADGVTKILVNGGNRDAVKISSVEEENEVDTDGGWFSKGKEPPFGVRQLIGVRQPGYSWFTDNDHDGDMEHRSRTGELRWAEKSYDLNEMVACMGVPAVGPDPYTGQQMFVMQPITDAAITEEYMDKEGWSASDKAAWGGLHKDQDVVLISDSPEFTDGIDVLPQTIPEWQQIPLRPDMAGQFPGPLYAPYTPIVMQPIPIVTYVMPGTVVGNGGAVVQQPGVIAPPQQPGVVVPPQPMQQPGVVMGNQVVPQPVPVIQPQ